MFTAQHIWQLPTTPTARSVSSPTRLRVPVAPVLRACCVEAPLVSTSRTSKVSERHDRTTPTPPAGRRSRSMRPWTSSGPRPAQATCTGVVGLTNPLVPTRVLRRAGTNRRCWHSRPHRWVLRLAWPRPQASQTAARLIIPSNNGRGVKCRVRLHRSSKHEEHKAEAVLLCGLYSLNLTAGRAMDFHDSCCRSDADCRAISMPACR